MPFYFGSVNSSQICTIQALQSITIQVIISDQWYVLNFTVNANFKSKQLTSLRPNTTTNKFFNVYKSIIIINFIKYATCKFYMPKENITNT